MTTLRRVIALVVTTVVSVGLLAAPASADHYYQPPTPYSDKYEFDPGCQGLDVQVQGRARGVSSIRFVHGTHGQAFLLKDRFRYNEVWTNTENGKWFRIKGKGLFKEVSAEFVANEDVPEEFIPPEGLIGPVYLFTAKLRGQPFTVKNSEGETILRDHGLVVFEGLFDTLGDSKPGATELNVEIVKVVGDFPGLDVDPCDLAQDLIS